MRKRSIAVVGLGNWGTSLAYGLHQAGVPIDELITSKKSRATVAAAKWARGLTGTIIDQSAMHADIFWLCVPDTSIGAVTRSLVRRASKCNLSLAGRLVVHSSGALSTEVLKAAASAGASVASVHPMMSFPSRRPVSLNQVPFGVEADAAAQRVLFAIIRRLGGRPFSIKPGRKALYHAAGMFASPLLVGHLAAALQAAEQAGLRPREARVLMQPIAQATLSNFFEAGARRSFSGPIARGDHATIRLHLQALAAHPMLADVYRSLARYSADAVSPPGRKELLRLLRVRNYKGTG